VTNQLVYISTVLRYPVCPTLPTVTHTSLPRGATQIAAMSTLVAIPAFNLLAQPIQDVLTGSARVGGVFATKENRVSIS
jgi:hypothetical protein